jgi:hypothetical protein
MKLRLQVQLDGHFLKACGEKEEEVGKETERKRREGHLKKKEVAKNGKGEGEKEGPGKRTGQKASEG